jgi:hypothetical protein
LLDCIWDTLLTNWYPSSKTEHARDSNKIVIASQQTTSCTMTMLGAWNATRADCIEYGGSVCVQIKCVYY